MTSAKKYTVHMVGCNKEQGEGERGEGEGEREREGEMSKYSAC